MNGWLERIARIWLRAEWLVAVIAAAWASTAFGVDGVEPGGAADVPLVFREVSAPFLFRDVRVSRHKGPFAAEPAGAAGKVVRGVLNFGNNPSNAISFLWQTGTKKLYLDLNRNRDLTDDAQGAISGFVAGPQLPGIIHHEFTNVYLTFPATSSGAPVLVNFGFLQIGDAVPLINVEERSFWEGRLTAGGHDWQVGLLPNLSDDPGSFVKGQVLLRPWDARDAKFYGWSGSIDSWAVPFEYRNRVLKAADAFEFSRQIFVEGCAFRLDWAAEPSERDAKFGVQFEKQMPALGEVTFAGSLIKRVVLTGGPYAVVLDHPAERVKVPVGSYDQPSVQLKGSEGEAYFDSLPKSGQRTVPDNKVGGVRPISGVSEAGKVVVVEEQKSTLLAMGGPLTNLVAVARQGRNLILTYRLAGANGDNYKFWGWWGGTNGGSAPQFAVFQKGRQVATGKFEFG